MNPEPWWSLSTIFGMTHQQRSVVLDVGEQHTDVNIETRQSTSLACMLCGAIPMCD